MPEPQWQAALDRGNEVRAALAAFVRDLKGRRPDDAMFHAADWLEQQTPETLRLYGSLRVNRLLSSIPRISEAKVYSITNLARVSPQRRLRQLTPEARGRLASELRERGERYRQYRKTGWRTPDPDTIRTED